MRAHIPFGTLISIFIGVAGVGLPVTFPAPEYQWLWHLVTLLGIGGTVFFVAWGVADGYSDRREAQGKSRLKLEPSHLIFAALLIATAAAGWQLVRGMPGAQKLAELEREIAKLKEAPAAADKPDLKISLMGLYTILPDKGQFSSGVAIWAKVWNLGKPTIIVGWRMSVVIEGRQMPAILSTSTDYTLGKAGELGYLSMTGSNNLILVTEKDEIGLKPREGYFVGFATNDETGRARGEIREVELRATDIYGVETKFYFTLNDMPKIFGAPTSPPAAAPNNQPPSGTEGRKQR